MDIRIDGKIALVTGGGTGIGTAYGRAGENRANPSAIIRAFHIVCQLAKNKKIKEK